jgi:hypothetical protein
VTRTPDRARSLFPGCLVLAALILLPAAASANALIDMATSQLGVTQPQAEGGMGALLSSARGNMGGDQYGELLSMVPDLGGLAEMAPAVGGSTGSGLGSLAGAAGSMLGGSTGSSLGSLAGLTQAFDGLGLSPDMVGQFSSFLLDYVQNEGGSKAFDLLKGALPI